MGSYRFTHRKEQLYCAGGSVAPDPVCACTKILHLQGFDRRTARSQQVAVPHTAAQLC